MKKCLVVVLLLLMATTGVQAALKPSNQAFTFEAGVSGKGTTNSWNIALLSKYGNKTLTDEDKNIILQATNSKLFRLSAWGEPYVAIKYNQMGLKVSGQVHANGQLPSEIVELAFTGNELGQEYTFQGANGEVAGYIETAAMLTFPLHNYLSQPYFSELTLGINAKYLTGLLFGQFIGEGQLKTTLEDGNALVNATGDAFYAYSHSGSGAAVDLGVSAALSPQLKLDASILNLGKITWRDVEEGVARFETELDVLDPDNASFESSITELGPGADITWSLPRTFRLAGSYQLNSKVTALAELSLNRSDALDLTARQTLGVEFLPFEFMPVQLTLSKRTKEKIRLDLGWGLKFKHFKFDLGLINPLGLFRTQTQGFGVVLHSSVRF